MNVLWWSAVVWFGTAVALYLVVLLIELIKYVRWRLWPDDPGSALDHGGGPALPLGLLSTAMVLAPFVLVVWVARAAARRLRRIGGLGRAGER